VIRADTVLVVDETWREDTTVRPVHRRAQVFATTTYMDEDAEFVTRKGREKPIPTPDGHNFWTHEEIASALRATQKAQKHSKRSQPAQIRRVRVVVKYRKGYTTDHFFRL
jgi:hypothetical protein